MQLRSLMYVCYCPPKCVSQDAFPCLYVECHLFACLYMYNVCYLHDCVYFRLSFCMSVCTIRLYPRAPVCSYEHMVVRRPLYLFLLIQHFLSLTQSVSLFVCLRSVYPSVCTSVEVLSNLLFVGLCRFIRSSTCPSCCLSSSLYCYGRWGECQEMDKHNPIPLHYLLSIVFGFYQKGRIDLNLVVSFDLRFDRRLMWLAVGRWAAGWRPRILRK